MSFAPPHDKPIEKRTLRDMAFGAFLALAFGQYIHHVILDGVREEADRAKREADKRCAYEKPHQHDHDHNH